MKSLVDSIYESISVLNGADLDSINVSVRKLQKLGLKKFENSAFKAGDEMDKSLIEIMERYDEYVEDLLYDILLGKIDAKDVLRRAEENERKTGTEALMVIHFLEDICNWLKI